MINSAQLPLLVLASVVCITVLVSSAAVNGRDLKEQRNILRELEELLGIKSEANIHDIRDDITKITDDANREIELAVQFEEVKKDYSNDPECATYDHTHYGCLGQCMQTSQCPGGEYISSLCPSHGNAVKCCFTANSDSECVNTFTGGHCISTSLCPNNDYVSNYCPTKPAGVKCCRTKPSDTCVAADGDCSDVNIIGRSEWGASSPTSISNLQTTPTYVFIHHTAGAFCSTISNCKARVKAIQTYHMAAKPTGNGWSDIGYSFLVGEDGNIYEGRGWDRVGAHTYGYNDVGIAFSFMGNFMTRKPNEAALDAVKNAIACGVQLGKISSSYTLRGHRDMGTTDCPGDKLYAEIQTWPHY